MTQNFLQAIREQKEEIDLFSGPEWIRRDQQETAEAHLDSPLIKVFMGPRRSGKSSLAHMLLRGRPYGYVNFDDERFMQVSAQDLNAIYQATLQIYGENTQTFFFDEIQNVEGWELFVNRLARRKKNIILTGSNGKLLSKELASHLTGRHFALEILPFSFREYLAVRGVSLTQDSVFTSEQSALYRRHFSDFLFSGGFPEALSSRRPLEYHQTLFDRIVSRDILQRYQVKFGRALKELALLLMGNYATRVSGNRLKNVFHLSSINTVRNYLGYLEDAYLIFQLQPFSHKASERLAHSRKLYVIDNGMARSLDISSTKNEGRLLENAVFLELRRRSEDLFFLETPKGEIDFVVREGRSVHSLVQVSLDISNPNTRQREFKPLAHASAQFPNAELVCVTGEEEGQCEYEGVKIQTVPAWKWFMRSPVSKL